MRNLQTVLFLGLLGMTLAAGCTLTTSTGDATGGQGGNDAAGSGGTTTVGGTTSTATGATSGTTSTATAFTANDCTAAGTKVPTTAPDISQACVACFYGTTGCPDAVACENKSGCMTKARAVMECVRLYYLYNQNVMTRADLEACQDGSLTAPPLDSGSITGVVSTNPNSWLGANIVTDEEMAAVQLISVDCATDCNAVPVD